MRCVACLLILLCLLAASTSAPAVEPQQPSFVLKDAVEQDWGIPPLASWGAERIIDGIGWKLGSVSRGDGGIAAGGFTVIHPAAGAPFSLKRCYVLAAYDLLPSGQLAVTVRDPQYYWPGYDYKLDLTDVLEVVWFSKTWEEEQALVLEVDALLWLDDFVLAPDQLSLLAIAHPEDEEGTPATAGHRLLQINVLDGEVTELRIPGTDSAGEPPAAWWPLLMTWDGGALLVQAGDELRRYEVTWQ